MNKTGIEYLDYTWNPVTGCTPCSPGCAHCWARRMALRQRGRNGYPADEPFQVKLRADRLGEPAKLRKPAVIGVAFMGDLFHREVPAEFTERIWDEMWRSGQHRFVVLTKRVERMLAFVQSHASRRSFGWTNTTRDIWWPGDTAGLEDIYYRDQCGWVGDGHDSPSGWVCEHPESDGECNVNCPVFCQADRDWDGHHFEDDGYDAEHELMECYARVRDGAAANVALGFSAWDQASLEAGARVMRQVRWALGPEAMLFVSLEPLLAPVSFEMKYWRPGADESESRTWSPLDLETFQGLPRVDVSLFNWVVVGCESGPGARPCEARWIEEPVAQCVAAGIPVFVKQARVDGKVVSMPEVSGRKWDQKPAWLDGFATEVHESTEKGDGKNG